MDVILVEGAAGGVGNNGMLLAAPGAAVANNEKPFKIVASRKYCMVRGVNRGLEEQITPEPEDKVCPLELEWFPKSGPLRRVRKWAQVRKSGCVDTAYGFAILVYRCYVPSSV